MHLGDRAQAPPTLLIMTRIDLLLIPVSGDRELRIAALARLCFPTV
jgi:hypothetical protein